MPPKEGPGGRPGISPESLGAGAKVMTGSGSRRIVVLAMFIVVAWIVFGNQLAGGRQGLVAAAASATSAPSAEPAVSFPPGITRAAAEEIAASAAPLDARLSTTTAGRYGDFSIERQYANFDPTRLVWGVKYDSIATPCYPGGHCESPRPGTVTVFLDYSTGEFLLSVGYFPKPE